MTKISRISWGGYDKGGYDKGFYGNFCSLDQRKLFWILLIVIWLNRNEKCWNIPNNEALNGYSN